MQINRREFSFLFKFIVLFFQTLVILLKEKPDVVISTGALATVPVCLLAKLFKKKLIFIESFSKITSPTITGKLMYRYADLFLVQWEDMKSFIHMQNMEAGYIDFCYSRLSKVSV